MDRLRVAVISDKSFPFYVGGYEVRVYELAKRLAATDEVRVYTSLPTARDSREGIAFERIASSRHQGGVTGQRNFAHSILFASSLLANPFSDWQPDILLVEAIPYIHLVTMRPWITSMRCVRVLDVCEAWSGYREVSSTSPPFTSFAVQACLKVGLGWADMVTAISGVTVSSLVNHYRLGVDPPFLVPMGLGADHIAATQRSANGTDDGNRSVDVVAAGRLVPSKRFDHLLRSLAILKRSSGWRGRAIIIGDGPESEFLRRLCVEMSLSNQVELLGFIGERRKLEVFANSKLFVLTSAREGFSLATLESMAQGAVPIILRPPEPEVFGASDFVKDGINGSVVQQGDASGLAKEIDRLIGNPSDRLRLSLAARLTAATYSWDAIARKLRADLLTRLQNSKDS
jgi:glycosyltransferase involved in cell wall biosynthesis